MLELPRRHACEIQFTNLSRAVGLARENKQLRDAAPLAFLPSFFLALEGSGRG